MGEPFVSVIVVSYNYANLLPRALEAIKNQSFTDYEIIMVDNGSTDNTQEVISNYFKRNPQIRVKHVYIEKNRGLFYGRNHGVAAASGKYIMFNDADDWMEPNCLQLLAERANETNADKICAFFKEIDVEGTQLRTVEYTSNFSKWLTVSLQATLYRRSIVSENNIAFHESWLDDIDFNTQFNYYAKGFEIVSTPIYNYFVNQLSTSGAKVKNRSWTYFDLTKDMLELFVPMIDKLDGQDRDELSYLMIKQYFFYLLHSNRYSSVKEIMGNYKDANQLMKKYMPSYLHDRFEKRIAKGRDRASGIKVTSVFLFAERMHCMKMLLCIYILLSKIKYLNP